MIPISTGYHLSYFLLWVCKNASNYLCRTLHPVHHYNKQVLMTTLSENTLQAQIGPRDNIKLSLRIAGLGFPGKKKQKGDLPVLTK